MSALTAEKVAQRAFDLGLVNERQLQDVWASLGSRNVRTDQLLACLVRRELLTNYQVERLSKGDRNGYFYGPYKVQYPIGAGSFARVFRAVHRATNEVVALKVLRNRYSDKPVQYNLFAREGRFGAELQHPNIVQIHSVFSEGMVHYLVMEFVEGRNLREFMQVRKKLDPIEATRLMIDMTDGLRHAFEHGVTHRDLKMSNVLISSKGQAKLVDFGLAAMDDTLLDTTEMDLPSTRTVDYAALERATNVRKDDTRTDIFFLGCIYYHMLTGQPPLPETQDRLARMNKNRFTDIAPIRTLEPEIPDCVAMVVHKSMMLDPNKRYQSPSTVLADLRMALARLTDESASGARRPRKHRAEPEHAVMIVESNAQTQEVLRKALRNAGYRVLLTADPERAVGRLRDDGRLAQCVIFNAQELGESAVVAFNEMAEDRRTKLVPAVLLLDGNQRTWQSQAKTDEHRVVLSMPITMRQLRDAIARMLPGVPARGQG